MNQLVVLVALVAACVARYPDDSAIYENMLLQDMYKRLSELADPAAQGYYAGDAPNWMNDVIALESRESGQADLRDHEYLQHSSNNDGFQYISGGAGEGKQHLKPSGSLDNTQEVKSDEALPFYCHPPNPCPKGYKGEDGCHEFIDDTADFQQEWILKMQKKGMCDCDEEHMFRCPKSDVSKQEKPSKYELDEVFDKLLNDKDNQVNPYLNKQEKRKFLVAKKAPIVKRSISDIDAILEKMKKEKRTNRFLQGKQELKRVAKKG